jgi:hypothetical protein
MVGVVSFCRMQHRNIRDVKLKKTVVLQCISKFPDYWLRHDRQTIRVLHKLSCQRPC